MSTILGEVPRGSLQRVCVFCGSSLGNRDAFQEAARELGSLLAANGIELIYGGGNCGLMGVLADEVLKGGGRVTGVIPEGLMVKELGHLELTQLHVVASMHERKAMMSSLADGFVATARWVWHLRGAVRSDHLGTVRPAPEACRLVECRGLLRPSGQSHTTCDS